MSTQQKLTDSIKRSLDYLEVSYQVIGETGASEVLEVADIAQVMAALFTNASDFVYGERRNKFYVPLNGVRIEKTSSAKWSLWIARADDWTNNF